jgi:hypothetical protein
MWLYPRLCPEVKTSWDIKISYTFSICIFFVQMFPTSALTNKIRLRHWKYKDTFFADYSYPQGKKRLNHATRENCFWSVIDIFLPLALIFKVKEVKRGDIWKFTFVGPCIVIYFCSKTNRKHNISNLFYFGTTIYMFRTVSPSIVRSLRLYIEHQV